MNQSEIEAVVSFLRLVRIAKQDMLFSMPAAQPLLRLLRQHPEAVEMAVPVAKAFTMSEAEAYIARVTAEQHTKDEAARVRRVALNARLEKCIGDLQDLSLDMHST